jgi:hypothetical protein
MLPTFINREKVRYESEVKGRKTKHGIRFPSAKPGTMIRFAYDLPSTTEKISVGDQTYTYSWKGHRVVGVKPKGAPNGFFTKSD